MPRPLYRGSQGALMESTRARFAAGLNLSAVADVHPQAADVLVVGALHLIDAKAADLATATVPRALGPRGPIAAAVSAAVTSFRSFF